LDKPCQTKWLFKNELPCYLLGDGRLAVLRAGAVSFFGGARQIARVAWCFVNGDYTPAEEQSNARRN
jgi:hypothetical protein